MNRQQQNLAGIGLSLLAALLLSLLPLPAAVVAAKPEWVLMVLIYWSLSLPDRVGILVAWCLGLLLDVLRGAMLGEHSLSLSVVVYLTLIFAARLRVMSLMRQAVILAGLVALYLLVRLMLNHLFHPFYPGSSYWLPVVTSALLWPWLFIILRDLRRYFNLND